VAKRFEAAKVLLRAAFGLTLAFLDAILTLYLFADFSPPAESAILC
jgi:hypothetical protein